MNTLQGTRLQDINLMTDEGSIKSYRAAPGSYFKDHNGEWRGVAPNGLHIWIKNHHVEEHEDRTISVLPGPWGSNSILVSNGSKSWHGYIRRGVWEEC